MAGKELDFDSVAGAEQVILYVLKEALQSLQAAHEICRCRRLNGPR